MNNSADIEVIKTDSYYKIVSTHVSPEIIINWKEKTVKIEGISLMSDPYSFYKKVKIFLQDILNRFDFKSIRVYIHFYYVNTQSLKMIISLLSIFERFGKNCKIFWYYSDDEINELGINLEELLENVDFERIYKPSDKNLFDF